MKTQYFDADEAARRYALYRPKMHRVALDWLAQHSGREQWGRALDVACGTGDSMVPLLNVCDEVIGIDSSAAMVAIAAERGLDAHHLKLEQAGQLGRFDLLSTCMAFHWFDPEVAVTNFKVLSNDGAVWLSYNFGLKGHTTNKRFNTWLSENYLNRFPRPPRNRASAAIPRDDPTLTLRAEGRGAIEVAFDIDTLVGYLSTQSNVAAAVRSGRTYADVCDELRDELCTFDLAGPFNYTFYFEVHEFSRDAED